jgi:DNA-binding Lrp family transcriptional regulator
MMKNELKDVERRLLAELLRNSRRSDRELAKVIGTSQPSVTRKRRKLEQAGFIREFTMIPEFTRLGYELMVFSFLKFNCPSTEKLGEERESFQNAVLRLPFEVLLVERGEGLEYECIIISIHKQYQSYINFRDALHRLPYVSPEVHSFIVSLKDEVHYIPFTFSNLAKRLAACNQPDEAEKKQRKGDV